MSPHHVLANLHTVNHLILAIRMGVWTYVTVAYVCISLMAYEGAHFLFGEKPFCEVSPPVSVVLCR